MVSGSAPRPSPCVCLFVLRRLTVRLDKLSPNKHSSRSWPTDPRSSSADKKTIEKMHRRLMIINHPDRGGSQYIATKVNEAKEVLQGTNNRGSLFR